VNCEVRKYGNWYECHHNTVPVRHLVFWRRWLCLRCWTVFKEQHP
jgi:hypothetical protein